jgi:PAS domain S-box-containing protein
MSYFLDRALSIEKARHRFLNHGDKMNIQLNDVINLMPEVIFYKDLNGLYQGGNLAWAELIGKPVSQMIGKSDLDIFPKESAESYHNNDLKMLAMKQETRNQEWIEYPDGRRILVETQKTPIRNKDGEIIGLFGICRPLIKAG